MKIKHAKGKFPKRVTSIICASLFLLASCHSPSHENVIRYEDFPSTETLQGSIVPLDTALFRYPCRIRLQGDKMVVMDLHPSDHFFHLFTYPQGHHLYSFGRKGDAPTEMLSAENMRWNDNTLWTLDANKATLNCFEWEPSADSLVHKETIRLDNDIPCPLDFVQYDDSTFLIPDYSGESRFYKVNQQGKPLKKWGTIPSTDKEALAHARPALAQAWRSFIDYNPRNGVLAAVTQLGEVLEIYNLKGNTHIVCIGPHGEPEFKVSEGYGIPTGIMGFSDVQVTDKAIYAAFQGISFKEIAQSAQKGDTQNDGARYIYVFDLKGKPLCKYTLDHYVSSFTVDEAQGIILATDVNKDEPIVIYHMNK